MTPNTRVFLTTLSQVPIILVCSRPSSGDYWDILATVAGFFAFMTNTYLCLGLDFGVLFGTMKEKENENE